MLTQVGVTEAQLESFAKERKDWLDAQGRILPGEKRYRLEWAKSNIPLPIREVYLNRGWDDETLVGMTAHKSRKEFGADVIAGGLLRSEG